MRVLRSRPGGAARPRPGGAAVPAAARPRPCPRAFAAACLLGFAALVTAPAPRPAPAPPSAPPPAALRWGGCPDRPVPREMRCATVRVPLDHAQPGRGTVAVALARIPATDRKRRLGSLLLNYGGPGSPGTAQLAADPDAFATLGVRYDLVAFDPRGIGHSDPVTCEGALSDGAHATTTTGDAAAQLAALRAAVRRCERASGPLLAHIGTVDVARDLDLLRRALGDRTLTYLGFSYGTRLGAVYAALFPDRTGRMVLDGVDTLTEPLAEQALMSARGQQRALEHFLTWCAHRPGCVYGSNTRTAKQRAAALVERLDREPLVGQDGSPVTGQDAVTAITAALYSRELWPALADALAAAERDHDPLGLLQLGGPTGPVPAAAPSTVPADNAEAALAAVSCADDPDRRADRASPVALEQQIAALKDDFRAVSPIFGPRQLRTVLACYGRPAGTDFIRRIDHPGAPRMLLVGTRGDPATPYEWTQETAQRLGSAVVVDHKGEGHTGYASSSCVRGYVGAFLLDGRLPSGTRSCPGEVPSAG